MHIRRLIPLMICGPLIAATGCTSQQIADWVSWNERDPAAAQEFANIPAVQASLATGDHEDRAPAQATQAAPEPSSLGPCWVHTPPLFAQTQTAPA